MATQCHSCDVYIISKKIHLYPGYFLATFQIFLNIVLNVIRGYDCQFESSSKRIILRWNEVESAIELFFTFFFSFYPFFLFSWQQNLFLSSLSNNVTYLDTKKGIKQKLTNKKTVLKMSKKFHFLKKKFTSSSSLINQEN